MTVASKIKPATDIMQVIGARTHNLKNINVDIPRNSFVVITGKSGSGKSSLAVDTVFAEGQRQYIESLSLYARQFFDQSSVTDVDHIEGLQPTICISQNRGTANPRSTVGTLTEIYDFLRLLMARVGTIRCSQCEHPVTPQTIDQICDSIRSLPSNSKVMVLAPIVAGRKGRHADIFEKIRKERLVRVRVDGQLHDIDNVPVLAIRQKHDIQAVTDRLIVRTGIEIRLRESIELAIRLSDGTVQVSYRESDTAEWQERLFSTKFACASCGTSAAEIEPRTFSFNSPFGACQSCDGIGQLESFEIERVIPDRSRSLDQGAIAVWSQLPKTDRDKRLKLVQPVLESLSFSSSQPVQKMNQDAWSTFLHSSDKGRPGLLAVLNRELSVCVDEDEREQLESFRGQIQCTSCHGTRLNPAANSVFLHDHSISQSCALPLNDAFCFFDSISFAAVQQEIAEPILVEIKHRLTYLLQVGLDYLTISRPANTLSGGELQRVRLASAIGSGLAGACYVLDEPSMGLHPRDNDRLIAAIRGLQAKGNSLIVVEHDEAIIRSADHIIDIGPDAGNNGGYVVAQGTCHDIEIETKSLTGKYLARRLQIDRHQRQQLLNVEKLSIRGARGLNLKSVDVDVPIGTLTCVTGVSGSGKSSLVYRTLAPAIKQRLGLVTVAPLEFESIDGVGQIGRLVEFDQRPISRTPRGCAATYTGVLDDIRKVFAATKTARQRGFTASRFSFNSKVGWCPTCEGHGLRRISMKFMSDVHVVCEACNGVRFNAATMQVRFREKTIADVLAMSVSEALLEFAAFQHVTQKLQCLADVGLGYLSIGQPSTTLSGGEAQRIRLATELAKTQSGHSLYLLDEPTTGLHFADVQMLLNVLSSLVENGNTVIVIEHNLDLIRNADWVIDLGPEGGQLGGQVIASGTPNQIAACAESHTGQSLRSH